MSKRFIKIIGIIIGSLLLLLTAFHFWFVYHAEQIIQDLVASKSGGRIRLEVRNFKFNWLSKKMELEDAVFYTTDSVNANTSYRFAVKEIKVSVRAIYPILFEERVMINRLSLKDPDIVVTRLQSTKKDTVRADKDFSIPQEMGRIYNSIQDALQVLQVNKFEIENARFTLVNKVSPDQLPVSIGKIDFHIDNLNVDTGKLTGNEKIFFSDNIVLKSRDQDIMFPDGRHRISYRKFRINIEKKIVEFDSCTIAQIKTDSSSTGFSIFFDALQMTNIDFDTLYRAEVIKADSVYCINPQFKLTVDLDRRTAKRKSAPRLDEIIRQLTGDLMLNFVVVNNASFDINTLKNDKPSSFTSSGNNFEIQGLRIDDNARRPLRVEKFAMAIRNYENFLRDSLYALQFDSILVNNDRIYLNNFSFQQRLNGKTVNSFRVPRFQLTGLSWDDLLFDRKLRATQAVLFNPTIDYTEAPQKASGKNQRRIFDALASMNEVIMLEDLSIVNGNIDLHLNGGIQMQLKRATLSVESRSLLGSSQLSGIRRSVTHLDFKSGFFKVNDITVNLDDITYTGAKSRLKAGNVSVLNVSNSINATAQNVTMEEIFINETTGDVNVTGVRWEKGDFRLLGFGPDTSRTYRSFISLTDINGSNTRLSSSWGNKAISAYINHIGAIAFLLKPGEKPIVAGLSISGNDLSVVDSISRTGIAAFELNDQQKAFFSNIRYERKKSGNTTNIEIPALSFVPDIQAAISGEFRAGEMKISKPVINIHALGKDIKFESGGLGLPLGRMTKLVIEQPELHFSQHNASEIINLNWHGKNSESNSIVMLDVETGPSGIMAKQLYLSLRHFILENPKGKSFDAGEGELTALINDIQIREKQEPGLEWQGTIATLEGRNFVIDSIGKKAGRLTINNVQLNDLAIRNEMLPSIRDIVAENKKFRIQQVTGSYTNSDNHFHWYNGGYDKSTKLLTLDSFRYSPAVDKDAFVKNHPYQADYIQVQTGAVNIGPFDMDKYLADSILRFGIMKVDDIRFNDYRDNRPPFHAGIIKPLMTTRIKSIPFKISIDSLLLNNAEINYRELNPKTNQTGIITLTRMKFGSFPFRNYDLSESDSLRINADGHLMDAIPVRIRVKESYTDSLAGFRLTVRMRPADMKVLNPVLGPLASARLRSGYLDSLSMRVAGDDVMAYGEMEMLYHDLKIEILRSADEKRKKFLSGMVNFLANTFVIKNKNVHRTNNVFFIRNQDRSPINYLIRILMSGVNTSVGVKNNRKVVRGYKKELRLRNLPPVDYD